MAEDDALVRSLKAINRHFVPFHFHSNKHPCTHSLYYLSTTLIMYFPNMLQFSYLLALFVPALATPVPIEAPIPFDDKESWSIGWSDDFKGESGVKFNSDKWGYQTPAKNENDEIQRYTDLADNARLTGQGTGVILPCKFCTPLI